MRMSRLSLVIATGACAMVFAGMLTPDLAPWVARENLFEFTARESGNRNPDELGAPPNGNPSTPSGDAEVAEGPTSVS